MTKTTTSLKAAKSLTLAQVRLRNELYCVSLGWPVFPVNSCDGGLCSCGDPVCAHPGKHPISMHGVLDATTDPDVIRERRAEHPNANTGIATGGAHGPIVIDIDPRNGGRDSLRQMEEENGLLPDGPRAHTGGDGEHIYLASSGGSVKSRIGLFPGIDIVADGKYVVAPGSIHVSGKYYSWKHGKTPAELPLPAPPPWLLELIGKKKSSQNEPDDVIPETQRNSTLASIAGSMRARGMTAAAIEAALLIENDLRCVPPLDESEVRTIAASISSYPPGRTGFASAPIGNEVGAERKLRFCTGKQIAATTPKRVPWLAPPWVALGAITDVTGKAKIAGKTTWVTHLVRAVLNGNPFMGELTRKTAVVYLTEQNPTSFRETMKRAGLLERDDFTVLFWNETLGVPWPEIVRAAADECRKRNAKLLVVDTLPQFAGLVGDSENSSGDALAAMQPLQAAASQGLAVLMVRHERKSGGAPGDSGRGSSAFAGAVDKVISISHPAGNHPQTVRLIKSVSRFSETPSDLLVEYDGRGFRSLGEAGEAKKQSAITNVLTAIPEGRKHAIDIVAIAKKTQKKRAQLQRLLGALLSEGKISKIGTGHRGDPLRYFSP